MLLPFEGKFNLKINKIMKQLLIYVVAMMAALFAAMFVHAEEESGLAKQMAVAEQAVAAEQAAVVEQTAVTGQETTSAQATAVQQPMGMTLRIGNSYIVNQNVMNSRAYMGYLQNTSPEVYGRFKSGYVTAMTGWGLFAAGPILTLCIGLPVWLSGDPCMYDHYDSHKVALHAGFGVGFITVGMGAFVSQASPVWGLVMEGCTGVQKSIISFAPTSPPPIGRFNPAPTASASLCISNSTFAEQKTCCLAASHILFAGWTDDWRKPSFVQPFRPQILHAASSLPPRI